MLPGGVFADCPGGLGRRNWLTTAFLDGCLQDRAFYKIGEHGAIDHPHQRKFENHLVRFERSGTFSSLFSVRWSSLVSFVAVLSSLRVRLGVTPFCGAWPRRPHLQFAYLLAKRNLGFFITAMTTSAFLLHYVVPMRAYFASSVWFG